jgi:hypothetical protein
VPYPTFAFNSVVLLTRSADTNSYPANGIVGALSPSAAAFALEQIGPAAGGEVILTTAEFEVDRNAVISGETSYRLYLYSVTPPSGLIDHAAWDLPSGDRASYLGYVDLGTPVDLGSTLYVETLQINKQITVPSGGTLYGYLVTIGAHTPQSGTVYRVKLHSVGV